MCADDRYLSGGEDKLLDEVTLTDNCCLATEGLRFVYNEYEVACHAEGAIEVAIPRFFFAVIKKWFCLFCRKFANCGFIAM